MSIKTLKIRITISRRLKLSVIQVKALEFNQLIKSLFQVTNLLKLQIKAQVLFELTLPTLIRALSEITMKIAFPSLQICSHQKPEPISIQKNGQDVASSESMMDMVGHSVLTFWEIICTLLSSTKFVSLKILLKPLNKDLQKLKKHSWRKFTIQKRIR